MPKERPFFYYSLFLRSFWSFILMAGFFTTYLPAAFKYFISSVWYTRCFLLRNHFIRNLRLIFDCDFIANSENIINVNIIIRTLPWTWLGEGGGGGDAVHTTELVSPTIKNLAEPLSKCDQIRSFQWIWLQLLKKSLIQ